MLRLTISLSGLLLASTALGQFSQTNSGGSASYGAFGNRTIGAGTQAGQSGFSSGQTSGGGNSQSSTGGMSGNSSQGGMGSGGAGGGQVGGSPSQGFQLGSSLYSAQQRSQAGFIGADNSESGNLRSMQGMQQGQANAFQNAFSQFARQNLQRNQNQNQNQQQNKKQLRIAIKAEIATTTAASTPTSLGRQFETRLTKLPGLDAQNAIHVKMEERTAVLTGSVVSDRDRRLVEGLALLEPGISAVRNELEVAAAATRAEELPAPQR